MGKVEKLSVLVVLFIAVVVVAMNLMSEPDSALAGGGSPLDEARARASEREVPETGLSQAERDEAELRRTRSQAAARPDLALNSSVDPGAVSAPEASGASALEGVLRDRSGLRPSAVSDLMIYDWKEGDSWASLAQRIYGDARYESVLRSANDNLVAPAPGTSLLVPVYDMSAQLAHQPPAGTTAQPNVQPTAPAVQPAPTNASPSAGSAPAAGSGKVHVVAKGDSLSSISRAYYGTEARWKEIAQANTGVLRDPNRLKLGMKLRIP